MENNPVKEKTTFSEHIEKDSPKKLHKIPKD